MNCLFPNRTGLRRERTICLTLLIVAAALLTTTSTPASAQGTPPPSQFVSKACGFQLQLPADWKIRPSRSKKCVFTVIVSHRASDEGIDLVVRGGTLEDGAYDLGFTKGDDGKWMLQGEEVVEAVQIKSASWMGLQGTVGSRIYVKGFYSGFGDQTRFLLFDRNHRIAEVTAFNGEEVVPEFVKGFEFLGKSTAAK